ncbi:MAG: hypothetical protein KDD52_07025 [Bdellovibrionales bacterium]|nr:hypothetical protein [Bdellovibrionales bacterium]
MKFAILIFALTNLTLLPCRASEKNSNLGETLPQGIHFRKQIYFYPFSIEIDGKNYSRIENIPESPEKSPYKIQLLPSLEGILSYENDYMGGLYLTLPSQNETLEPYLVSSGHNFDAGYDSTTYSRLKRDLGSKDLQWIELQMYSYIEGTEEGDSLLDCGAETTIRIWDIETSTWKQIDQYYGFNPKVFPFTDQHNNLCFTASSQWRFDPTCELDRRNKKTSKDQFDNVKDFIDALKAAVEKGEVDSLIDMARCSFRFDFKEPYILVRNQPRTSRHEIFANARKLLSYANWSKLSEIKNTKSLVKKTFSVPLELPKTLNALTIYPGLPPVTVSTSKPIAIFFTLEKNEQIQKYFWTGMDTNNL